MESQVVASRCASETQHIFENNLAARLPFYWVTDPGSLYMCIHICMCIYIYIYCVYIYICMYLYIYIYIDFRYTYGPKGRQATREHRTGSTCCNRPRILVDSTARDTIMTNIMVPCCHHSLSITYRNIYFKMILAIIKASTLGFGSWLAGAPPASPTTSETHPSSDQFSRCHCLGKL